MKFVKAWLRPVFISNSFNLPSKLYPQFRHLNGNSLSSFWQPFCTFFHLTVALLCALSLSSDYQKSIQYQSKEILAIFQKINHFLSSIMLLGQSIFPDRSFPCAVDSQLINENFLKNRYLPYCFRCADLFFAL